MLIEQNLPRFGQEIIKMQDFQKVSFHKIHHVAIIASDYKKSKEFYTEILGLKMIREVFRKERNSYKLDLEVNESCMIELFSFPNPPPRATYPEAAGLRHLAFEVDSVENTVGYLNSMQIKTEPVRIDECTGKKCTFFHDPDELPIELYEK